MEGFSLKSRAIAFAMCAGAVAFILALAAGSTHTLSVESAGRALIAAIVCGVMSWASAERTVASTASAIDAAIARLSRAANGDLEGEIPEEVKECVPPLATAMEGLFRQLNANLDSVQRLAMFDPVTGLANRTNFRRTAERVLADMQPGTVAALYFIDLDRFKAVNDTLGHATGDMLLGMVANRLRAVADRFTAEGNGRPPLIGRLAGDEFTMFFPEIRTVRDADRIGRGILYALSEAFDLADQEVSIGASIGIAMRPEHGTTLHDLMRAADAAMYHAKSLGRGRAEHFTDLLAAEIAERAQLESDLREAVDKDEFALVFQPQVSAGDGHIVGAEALLRWKHRDGLKMPAAFIQRAEETGLIVEIGEWVIEEVAETISRWGRMGIPQRLAVNISPRQLDHASFFRRLREAMLAASAPAKLLELEITETLAMHCSEEVVDAIALLRADGASIAIDDFGTGYSNLARLRELPVDRVKLDRSLIEKVAENAEARAIAQAVIGLVHGLGCEAVAEGIESEAQAAVLRVIGCDILQGYAIAQPMAEGAFLEWVRTEGWERAAG
ncbi:putative bifunctional diguanylate cyclase/phosphodiesterase [Sphingomonas canadensis]|uniref:Bifunctional diguanylate cyclase/phosphodiesterase n=1 Tax=Sphingomonas canadensis TaxID=1219257 RepID=A0ABW3H6V9_9SPHN|nr:bifunctional diguanylate cyclase/phosphodiesterase [Sphingomonas canadensis]MCW3835435.1 bifunctional diguanylate cyclase/phosphodiesterase [Sphingomonas canadensis]